MKASSLLPLGTAFVLAGCMGSRGVSYDRQAYMPLNASELSRQPACALRVCVKEPRYTGFKGSVQASHLGNLAPFFASVLLAEQPTPELCDVALRHDSPLMDWAELTSAYTGGFLARFQVLHSALGGAVCKLFAEGTEGFARIQGGSTPGREGAAPGTTAPAPKVAFGAAAGKPSVSFRPGASVARASAPPPASVPSAPPAPAPGLSAADIERIARAVRGPEPAAAPAGRAFPASPEPTFSAQERPDDLALILGIESYSDIAAKASYAERDADAFKAHVRALGVPERNIVLLKGAKAGKAAIEKNLEAWLPRLAKPSSRVYVYFSGHGAPDVKTGRAYLVPWDGDPNFLENTAYPLEKLYRKLGELPARQVLVAMDSCFSGAGGRSVLAAGVRPLVTTIETGAAPATLTVLSASASNEISGALDDKGHGAFTYFLLEGLDAGRRTPRELAEYLTPRVQDEARRLNRDQTPQLLGDGSWPLR